MEPFDSSVSVQFQNIMVATDFSPAANTALLYALAIARRQKSRVWVVHVVNPQGQRLLGHDAVQRAVNDAWRNAHAEMTNQFIEGRLEGVENHVVVVQGETWEELQKLIEKFHIDLLVTGTRGRTGVWKVLLGSTAETIFRQATCAVLTIGPKITERVPPSEGPKKILYSTGFARQSLYAGIYALGLAQRQRATLGMLHVVNNPLPDTAERRAELEQEYSKKLLSLIPADAELAAPPETFVRFGSTADAIVELADEWHPDLIVMGIRRPEREARRRWATAYSVVANACCPVMTVRTPQ